MDKIDQQYLNEIVGGTESGDVDTQHDLKVHEENTTIEELEVYFIINSFAHIACYLSVLSNTFCSFLMTETLSFRLLVKPWAPETMMGTRMSFTRS